MFLKYISNEEFLKVLNREVEGYKHDVATEMLKNINTDTQVEAVYDAEYVSVVSDEDIFYNFKENLLTFPTFSMNSYYRKENEQTNALLSFQEIKELEVDGGLEPFLLYDMIYIKVDIDGERVSGVERLQGAYLPNFNQVIFKDGVYQEANELRVDTIIQKYEEIEGGSYAAASHNSKTYGRYHEAGLENSEVLGFNIGTVYKMVYLESGSKENLRFSRELSFYDMLLFSQRERLNCQLRLVLNDKTSSAYNQTLSHMVSSGDFVCAEVPKKQKRYPKVDAIEALIKEYNLMPKLTESLNLPEDRKGRTIITKHDDVILMRYFNNTHQLGLNKWDLVYFSIYKDGKQYDARLTYRGKYTHTKPSSMWQIWENSNFEFQGFDPESVTLWKYLIPSMPGKLDEAESAKFLLEALVNPELEMYAKSPMAHLLGTSQRSKKTRFESIIASHVGIINKKSKKVFERIGMTFNQIENIYDKTVYGKSLPYPIVIKSILGERNLSDFEGTIPRLVSNKAQRDNEYIDISSHDPEYVTSIAMEIDSLVKEVYRYSQVSDDVEHALRLLLMATYLNKTVEDNLKTIKFMKGIINGDIEFAGYDLEGSLKYRLAHYQDYLDQLLHMNLTNSENIEPEIAELVKSTYRPYASSGSIIDDRIMIMSSQVDKIKNKEYLDKMESQKEVWLDYEYQSSDLVAITPDTPFDIYQEGSALHHCVASYVPKVASGSTMIVFIRDVKQPNLPYYTMEIVNNRIVQVRGLQNQQAVPVVDNFVKEYRREILAPKLKTRSS